MNEDLHEEEEPVADAYEYEYEHEYAEEYALNDIGLALRLHALAE